MHAKLITPTALHSKLQFETWLVCRKEQMSWLTAAA